MFSTGHQQNPQMFCMGLHVVLSFHNASGLPPPIATRRDCVFIKDYEQKRMTTVLDLNYCHLKFRHAQDYQSEYESHKNKG